MIKETKIPIQLIIDYAIVAIVYVGVIVGVQPVYVGNYNLTTHFCIAVLAQTSLYILMLYLGEAFVTYVLSKPFVYEDDLKKRILHFVLCAVVEVPIMMCLINQANVIVWQGMENACNAWKDMDGAFTLNGVMRYAPQCLVGAFVSIVAMTVLCEVRRMRKALKELMAINQALENRHEMKDDKTNDVKKSADSSDEMGKIEIHGEGKSRLEVNPADIIYVEALGNYSNIAYYDDTKVNHIRLRTPLKDIEDTLAGYTFFVHTHRAFLVNINYVTQVTGNSSGYKLEMFGVDKILPVSKSNIDVFKDSVMLV